jgi:prepilin-type N-terminal cleavage/methylation domain-containing protein
MAQGQTLPSQVAARRRARGMTLIEIVVVLALIAIVAALSLNALSGLQPQANYSKVSSDFMGALQQARAEAFGQGATIAFVVDTAGNRYWAVQPLSVDTATFLDTFDPADPEASGKIIVNGTMTSGVTFGPAAGYGQALTVPFANVPSYASSSPAPNENYCSFCRTSGTNSDFGLIVFDPTGSVRFNSEAPAAPGQQVTITGTINNMAKTQTLAIIAASGVIERFEK